MAIEGAKAILADASALAEAEVVYADTEATQTAINQAATNLMTAVNNLLVTETDNRLDILIQKAEELLQKEDQYTNDSVQALKDALKQQKRQQQRKMPRNRKSTMPITLWQKPWLLWCGLPIKTN